VINIEMDASFQSLPLHIPRVPSTGAPPPPSGSPHRDPSERDAPILEALHSYLKVPGK